jgi:hypothetical protein
MDRLEYTRHIAQHAFINSCSLGLTCTSYNGIYKSPVVIGGVYFSLEVSFEFDAEFVRVYAKKSDVDGDLVHLWSFDDKGLSRDLLSMVDARYKDYKSLLIESVNEEMGFLRGTENS